MNSNCKCCNAPNDIVRQAHDTARITQELQYFIHARGFLFFSIGMSMNENETGGGNHAFCLNFRETYQCEKEVL